MSLAMYLLKNQCHSIGIKEADKFETQC